MNIIEFEATQLKIRKEFFEKRAYRWKLNSEKTYYTLYYKKPNSINYNPTNIIVSCNHVANYTDKMLEKYFEEMSKHDSKDCGLTLEDLKAQNWEVVE